MHAARLLRNNPGLKRRREELLRDAYADARKEAASESGLPLTSFPQRCPFTLDDVMDEDFWARPAGRS